MKIIACHLYVSPRARKLTNAEREVRRIAYSIKTVAEPDVGIAARDMAQHVRGKAVLVPVPDHTGHTTANLALCMAIARLRPECSVCDVIARPAADSQCELERQGKPRWPAHALNFSTHGTVPAGRIVFVDNVARTGATMRACQHAVGRGTGIVWADARPAARPDRQPGLWI
jgi:predicted amidophosphoribosyltransferase